MKTHRQQNPGCLGIYSFLGELGGRPLSETTLFRLNPSFLAGKAQRILNRSIVRCCSSSGMAERLVPRDTGRRALGVWTFISAHPLQLSCSPSQLHSSAQRLPAPARSGAPAMCCCTGLLLSDGGWDLCNGDCLYIVVPFRICEPLKSR